MNTKVGGTSFEGAFDSILKQPKSSSENLLYITDAEVPEEVRKARLHERIEAGLQNIFGADEQSKVVLKDVLVEKIAEAHGLVLQTGMTTLQAGLASRQSALQSLGDDTQPLTKEAAESLCDEMLAAMSAKLNTQNNVIFISLE